MAGSGVLTLVLIFVVVPLAIAGGIASLVRSTRRNLPPAEANRKAMKAFWIVFIIIVACELILLGLCVATLNQMG